MVLNSPRFMREPIENGVSLKEVLMKIEKHQQSLLNIDTVVKKIDESTSSVTELRIPIFLPIAQLTHNSLTLKNFKKNGNKIRVKTNWGECEVRINLLTQVHRDLLDCIMTYKTDMRPYGEDEVLVLFSQTKILDKYSSESGTGKKNTKWLKLKIEEIRSVIIKPIEKGKLTPDFNIIRSIIDASSEYNSYGIIFDKRYLDFFMQELTINYEKILPDLLQVENATFKSIIRWFLTHKKDQKFFVDTVLSAIGYPTDSPQMVRKIKRELAEHHEVFLKFGIEYDPTDRIFYYRGNEAVGFIPSLLKKKERKVQGKVKKELVDTEVVSDADTSYVSNRNKTLTEILQGKIIELDSGKVSRVRWVEGDSQTIKVTFTCGEIKDFKNTDNWSFEKFKEIVYKGILHNEVL